jgi:5-methylthioadenosine/S-adenosylhomocysteine deaminase
MSPKRMLIRGGVVLSVDPDIGELPKGDVLIEDGVIAAVAPELEVSDGARRARPPPTRRPR